MSADALRPRRPAGTVTIGGTRSLPAVVAIPVAVLAAVIVWVRLGPVSRNVVWAEDSRIFLQQRLHSDGIALVWRPYGGYEQLVPRLLADVAVAIQPVERYAVTVTALSCVAIGFVGGAVFLLAADVVPQWPLRALLGLVPAVLPLAPVEIAGNLANLHWFLLFLAPWVFRARPTTWWTSGLLAVVALLVVGSEIQAALFLPLLLVGLTGPRPWRVVPIALVGVSGTVWQVLTLLGHPRLANTNPVGGVHDTAEGYLLQALGGSATASVQRIASAFVAHGWAVLVIPAVLVVAVLVAAWTVAPWRTRVVLVALAGGSVAIWTAAVVLNPNPATLWATMPTSMLVGLGPSRYAASASMFLVAALVVAAAVLVAGGRIVLPVIGWIVVAGVVAAAVTSAGPLETRRSDGPSWADEVARATPVCRAHPSRSVFLQATPDTAVWGAVVPCHDLLGSSR